MMTRSIIHTLADVQQALGEALKGCDSWTEMDQAAHRDYQDLKSVIAKALAGTLPARPRSTDENVIFPAPPPR
jgi:hypothetical protein